jgi:hypothetical protein
MVNCVDFALRLLGELGIEIGVEEVVETGTAATANAAAVSAGTLGIVFGLMY